MRILTHDTIEQINGLECLGLQGLCHAYLQEVAMKYTWLSIAIISN